MPHGKSTNWGPTLSTKASFGALYKGSDKTNNMDPIVWCPSVLNSRRINLVSQSIQQGIHLHNKPFQKKWIISPVPFLLSRTSISTTPHLAIVPLAVVVLAGTINAYSRHVFLCYKSSEAWPSCIEGSESDPLPKFACALKARKNNDVVFDSVTHFVSLEF